MRCTDALWSGSGFRTQRCLRDPAEDGDHLGTMTEVWMEFGLIPGEQLFPDCKPLRPISESKHQGCLNPHSIPKLNSAQATLPKKKSKAWIQEENSLHLHCDVHEIVHFLESIMERQLDLLHSCWRDPTFGSVGT